MGLCADEARGQREKEFGVVVMPLVSLCFVWSVLSVAFVAFGHCMRVDIWIAQGRWWFSCVHRRRFGGALVATQTTC